MRTYQLIAKEGLDAGTVFSLHEGVNRIGRSSNCDVRLSEQDITVSGRHLTLEVRDAGVVARDVSRGGTRLDGVPLEKGTPAPVAEGQTLALGKDNAVVLALQVLETAPPTPPPAPPVPRPAPPPPSPSPSPSAPRPQSPPPPPPAPPVHSATASLPPPEAPDSMAGLFTRPDDGSRPAPREAPDSMAGLFTRPDDGSRPAPREAPDSVAGFFTHPDAGTRSSYRDGEAASGIGSGGPPFAGARPEDATDAPSGSASGFLDLKDPQVRQQIDALVQQRSGGDDAESSTEAVAAAQDNPQTATLDPAYVNMMRNRWLGRDVRRIMLRNVLPPAAVALLLLLAILWMLFR